MDRLRAQPLPSMRGILVVAGMLWDVRRHVRLAHGEHSVESSVAKVQGFHQGVIKVHPGPH